MKYAVIRTGGKQYRVKEGDTLEVDKLPVAKDSAVTFEEVLLWASDGQVKIGTPNLPDVKVKAKVLDQIKGEKIRVAKFKSKVRYRRVMGFRSLLTRIQIEKIESGGIASSVKGSIPKTEAVLKVKKVKKPSRPKKGL